MKSEIKSAMDRLLLYLRTIRNLTPGQVVYRIIFEIKKRLFRLSPRLTTCFFPPPSSSPEVRNPLPITYEILDLYPEDGGNIKKIKGGWLEILGRRLNIRREIDWNRSYFSPLFTYHLNYFDYAPILARDYHRTKDKDDYLLFKRLSKSFIKRAVPGRSPGWEPYPLATRTVNWLYAAFLFGETLISDIEFYKNLFACIHQQLSFLEKNLEFHLSGNHLIRDARALIIGGAVFTTSDGERWLRRGVNLLKSELRKQVFPDGGHKEGSAHYHFLVLRDLVESLMVVEQIGYDAGENLYSRLSGMIGFLASIRHPDGTLPLIGDGDQGNPAVIDKLIKRGEKLLGKEGIELPRPKEGFPDSGYFLHRADRSSIIIAAGSPPPHLSGHLHAHLLSYELTVDGKLFIVDSGTGEYQGEEMRDYFRGTAAHNTVLIDGKNQFELWACFRVGRRARILQVETKRGDSDFIFSGCYQPYHSPNITHRRGISYDKGQGWTIEDEVTGGTSLSAGSFVHLHPEVEITEEGNRFSLSLGNSRIIISPFGIDEAKLASGWYAPYFGGKVKNKVLSFNLRLSDRSRFGYTIKVVDL